MKVKVKGLVFVGFAAMIFAANAMAAGDNTVTSKSYVDTNFQAISDKAQDLTATGETAAAKYPSVAAVKTALGNIPGAEAYTGGNLITVTGHEISTTAEVNVLEGVQVAGVDQTIDANKKVNLGAAAGKAVDTSITAGSTSTDVPTTAAVAAYVANQPGAEAYTGGNLITVNDHEISTTAQVNVLEGVKVNGTALTIDTNDKTVNLGAAAGKGADTSITDQSTDANVPTSAAVYDFVTDLNNGQSFPEEPTAAGETCDADHPCALVNNNGTISWKRIAQVGE